MSLEIRGIGTAVPGEAVSQEKAAQLSGIFFEPDPKRQQLLPALFRRSRVESRHSVVEHWLDGDRLKTGFYAPWRRAGDRGPTTAERMELYERAAAPLAQAACERALDDAALDASRVTHIVTVSCSGFSSPGVDVHLIKQLGLPPGVARAHVGFMGCHAALNGLRLARSFVEADPAARVLVCAVELCSLHMHYGWDPEKVVANAIFADGAAALVGTAPESGNGGGWQVTANGSAILEDSEEAMSWRIRDHGFEMTLSPRVPDVIRRQVRPWLEGWLAGEGLAMEGVGSWAVHPGGPRILKAFADGIGLERRALTVSYETLARYGNMSSPTVLFLLERLRGADAPLPAVALGFGPGLAIESCLIRPGEARGCGAGTTT